MTSPSPRSAGNSRGTLGGHLNEVANTVKDKPEEAPKFWKTVSHVMPPGMDTGNIGCGLKYTAMDAIMRVVYDIGLDNKVQVFQFSAECFSSKSKSH